MISGILFWKKIINTSLNNTLNLHLHNDVWKGLLHFFASRVTLFSWSYFSICFLCKEFMIISVMFVVSRNIDFKFYDHLFISTNIFLISWLKFWYITKMLFYILHKWWLHEYSYPIFSILGYHILIRRRNMLLAF